MTNIDTQKYLSTILVTFCMPPSVINFWMIAKSQEALGWISDEARSVSNKKKQIGWRFSSEVECFTDTLAGFFPQQKNKKKGGEEEEKEEEEDDDEKEKEEEKNSCLLRKLNL